MTHYHCNASRLPVRRFPFFQYIKELLLDKYLIRAKTTRQIFEILSSDDGPE